MLIVHGPTYRYDSTVLTSPELIYIIDHHYNEDTRSYPINSLLENSQCDPLLHTIFFESVVRHDDNLKGNLVCLPIFLLFCAASFNKNSPIPNWANKHKSFNFMINKPRLHREFLLRLIEHFKLTDYTYTLCWQTNNIPSRRITNSKYQFLDIPITIPPQQHLLGTETLLERGIHCNPTSNANNYKKFLKDNVFEPSCISLITEPSFYERETHLTEKTIMAIWGGTIPIWVGGWKIPEYMQSLGFDIFDDVVDHSYQDLDDPWDRCYYAIEKNLELLNNKQRLLSFINNNTSRLNHNLELLKTNQFKQDALVLLDNIPAEVRTQFTNIVPIATLKT